MERAGYAPVALPCVRARHKAKPPVHAQGSRRDFNFKSPRAVSLSIFALALDWEIGL
jgi:hypothetical protein